VPFTLAGFALPEGDSLYYDRRMAQTDGENVSAQQSSKSQKDIWDKLQVGSAMVIAGDRLGAAVTGEDKSPTDRCTDRWGCPVLEEKFLSAYAATSLLVRRKMGVVLSGITLIAL
jgi:hypothetical protein